MSGWLPDWPKVQNARSAGGTYGTDYYPYPWRICLHTMEASGMGNPGGHASPPHLWYNPATREKAQTVPLDRSAFALYQPGESAHYTNKARALQIELVGFAAEAGSWPDQYLRNIALDVVAPLCQWVAQNGGGRINLGNVPAPGAIPGSASEYAAQRLSDDAWANLDGICGHRHVPYNDHWDAGGLDMRRIAGYAAEILGGSFAPVSEEEDLTPDEKAQLKTVFDILKGLTPYLQQTYNQSTWQWDTTRATPPADTDKVVRDTFNNTQWILDKIKDLEASEGGGDGSPVLDVEASLKQATDEQLLRALLARKAAA